MRFLVFGLGFLGSNFSLCFLVSSEMFSSSSGNFRGLLHGERSNQGGGGGGFGSHGKVSLDQGGGHGDVSGGYSEAVDVVSSVVDSLDHVVGINVLIAASGHSESVLRFSSGGVDVLIAKAELPQLVLGVELAGGRLNYGSHGNWGDGKRMGKGSSGGNNERLVDRKGERNGLGGERKGSREDRLGGKRRNPGD